MFGNKNKGNNRNMHHKMVDNCLGGMKNNKEKASMITEELKSRNRRPLYKAEEVKVSIRKTHTPKKKKIIY